MNKMTYEEYLDTYGKLTYSNVGKSMLPLIKQGRDLFTVEKKTPKRCKKYDVVLYRRNSQYVLHRIVKVREKDYVICGDNCMNLEYGITDSDIIGIMTDFVRKGKSHSINEKGYIVYSRLIVATFPLRHNFMKIKNLIKEKQ